MNTPEELVDLNARLTILAHRPLAPGSRERIHLLQGSLDTLTEILRDPSALEYIADRTARDAADILRIYQRREA